MQTKACQTSLERVYDTVGLQGTPIQYVLLLETEKKIWRLQENW